MREGGKDSISTYLNFSGEDKEIGIKCRDVNCVRVGF